MFELGNRDQYIEVLVQGEDEPRRLPLAGSMSVSDGMAFAKVDRLPKAKRDEAMMDIILEFFRKHLGDDVVDSISMSDFEALAEVWQGASDGEGVGAGESQASPQS